MTPKEHRLIRMLAEVLEVTEPSAVKRRHLKSCECLEMDEFLCHWHQPRWNELRAKIRKELAGGPN